MTAELTVLCEGPTESSFIRDVLSPHLKEFGVFPKAIPLCKGNYGIIPFQKVHNAVKSEVGRLRRHQYLTTMVDFYRLGEFPGDAPNETDVYVRVTKIETAMAKKFNNPNVIPYIQLHEFETFVFVDLEKLNSQYPDGEAAGAVVNLRAEAADIPPELVDDGPASAPSKRLLREFPGYRKVVDGPAVALAIGIDRLRAACPHFEQWLGRLETLAE